MVLLTLAPEARKDKLASLRGKSRRVAARTISLLDFAIALGRKAAGFCALLTLGWIYFRLLATGETLHHMYPAAPDPDLRQDMWTALLLIMAQGWDIPPDEIAVYWMRLRAPKPSSRVAPAAADRPARLAGARRLMQPVVGHLGRFMDLCVALANKVGALAALGFLAFIVERFCTGTPVQAMYPNAHDPVVSLLADLCVYVVVLGWWAMPIEQIRLFWHRLRGAASE